MLGRIYSAKRVDVVIAHRAWLHVAQLILLCREGDVVDLALLARLPGVILVLSRCCIIIRWHLEAGVLKIKFQGGTQYLFLRALRLDLFALLVGLVEASRILFTAATLDDIIQVLQADAGGRCLPHGVLRHQLDILQISLVYLLILVATAILLLQF